MVDVRTDIYALGCIFYYALTQKYPFGGDTMPQVMVAHLSPPHEAAGSTAPRPARAHRAVGRMAPQPPAGQPPGIGGRGFAGVCGRCGERCACGGVGSAGGDTQPGDDEGICPGSKKLITPGSAGSQPAPRVSSRCRRRARTTAAPGQGPLPQIGRRSVPFLIILIGGFGVKRFIERLHEAERQERFAEIVSAESPR